jgi:hypothetical protein
MEKKAKKQTAAEAAGINVGDKFESGKRLIKEFQVDRISKGGRVAYDERRGKGVCASTKLIATLADDITWRKVREFTKQ